MSMVQQMLLTALLAFLLAGSLLGIAVGAALLARSARALSLFAAMNRWVSTRRVLRPVELPRETGHGNRMLGVIIIVAGAYALVVLSQMPLAKAAAVLRISPSSTLALVGLDTLKWLLIVGCAASVAAGAMLVFFPRGWQAIEARANRWYSSRQLTAGGDDMHVPLDHLAERHPRAAGALILVLSLASAAASALLLLRH